MFSTSFISRPKKKIFILFFKLLKIDFARKMVKEWKIYHFMNYVRSITILACTIMKQ